jgi:hypothetical protein
MAIEPDVDRWNHGGPPDPSAPLKTYDAEVWPFAADETGIWLLSGEGPWPTPPIHVGTSAPVECEWELTQHGAAAVVGPHQCSTREDWATATLTHYAVIACAGAVRTEWPRAKPVPPKLVQAVGKPPTHAANATPEEIRLVDVLHHTLRAIAFELSPWGNAELADKLDGHWRRHLTAWEPELYRLYDRVHQTA